MTQILPAKEFFDRCDTGLHEELRAKLAQIPPFRGNDSKDDNIVGAPAKAWLGGGAIRRMITRQGFEDADFDFFFMNEYEEKKFCGELVSLGFKETRNLTHAVTYEKGSGKNHIEVQAIRMNYYQTPEDLINSFDYTCCMGAYDGQNVYLGDYTLLDNGRMRLAVNKITYPVASLRRLTKYTKQGYYACNGCLTQIAEAIHALDPVDFKNSNITYID